MEEEESDAVTRDMMKGFIDKCTEAGTQVTGGQSVRNPWPLIGGAAMSVNHLHEGVGLALKGTLEKRSDVLGRSARWAVQRRVARLPKFLCVQMMRFFWKAAADDGLDHGGAAPEEVLVPAQAWLVGDLH
jgi:hypothetical protein